MSAAPKTRRLRTNQPQLPEATIASIRAAARQYVHAGGSVFPASDGDTDRDEHIGMVADALRLGNTEDAFADVLEEALPSKTHYTQHEAVHSAAWSAITAHTDAAFLFGAFVGLELASLTFCNLATVETVNRRARKDGAR